MAVVFSGSGCLLIADPQAARPCEVDSQCPYLYVCQDLLGSGTKTCEPLTLDDRDGGGGGGGGDGGGTPDAGGGDSTVYYCGDAGVAAVFAQYCVTGCHGGATPVATGTLPAFRLDAYEDSASHKGAGNSAVVAATQDRTVVKKTMPFGPMPDAQRQVVADWVAQGAKNCATGGTPDAGSPDGGSGATSFSRDVLPVLKTHCEGCHLTASASNGNLSLTAANAYTALVGRASTCNAAVMRVQSGNTTGSMVWRKSSNDPTKCGTNPMPPAGALKTVAPADFGKLEKWIQEGAQNN